MVSSWVEGKEGVAEHLVYLNKEGKELQKLLAGEKNAIIRGAAGRKSPLGGRAKVGDRVYFVETGGDLLVTHRGMIENVIETEKMTPEESQQFVEQHQSELNLSKNKWSVGQERNFWPFIELLNWKRLNLLRINEGRTWMTG